MDTATPMTIAAPVPIPDPIWPVEFAPKVEFGSLLFPGGVVGVEEDGGDRIGGGGADNELGGGFTGEVGEAGGEGVCSGGGGDTTGGESAGGLDEGGEGEVFGGFRAGDGGEA